MHGLWEHFPPCGLVFFFFGVVLFKMFILSFESHKIYSFVTLFLHCLFYQTGLVSSSLMKGKGGESRSVMSSSLQPHELYSPWNSLCHNTGVGNLSLLQGIFPTQRSNQGLHIAGGFFTSWATLEDQNTGLGSLSLLQRIFPTQELNWGLLHYRWILYHLSY